MNVSGYGSTIVKTIKKSKARKNSLPRAGATLQRKGIMPEATQDLTQEQIEEALRNEGSDRIEFGIVPHVITQEPLFVVTIHSKNGDTASAKMEFGEALGLGAQITAQATTFLTLSQMGSLVQQGANKPGIVVP